MTKKASTQMPQVELATKDWTIKELMDTERRIEKAFHEQTQFLSQKMDNNIRWMIGLIVTMTIAIILAVLFKS
jgi:tetrahydromethanopterin S-methyltransferase subunit G